MNHETPKLRVVGDAAKSAERLREKLVKALDIIDAARREDGNAQAEGKPGTAWRYLSAAVGALRSLLHPEPGTIAWHTEIDYYLDHEPHLRWDASGEYRTPKSALDFVMANPPLNIPPAAEPIDPSAPKMVRGHAHVWAKEPDSVGNYHRGDVVQSWVFADGAGVHVFAKQLFEDGEYKGCWNVTGAIDCERVFFGTMLCGRARMAVIAKFIRNGLLAARLRRKHKNANKNARSVCGDSVAAPHPEPLSPEEELADTIKRQKEEVQA